MIIGYYGLPRSGKTMGMVMQACKDLKEGKRVVSNVPIIDIYYGSKKQAIYRSDIVNELYTCRDTTVCIDEAPIVLDSRFFNKMPAELVIGFAQSGKRSNNIYYTSQGWTHAVKRLRDLTNYAVKCTKIFPRNDNPFMFVQTTLDPEYYMLKSPKKYEKEYVVKKKFIIWGKDKLYKSYNTYHEITDTYLNNAPDITKSTQNHFYNQNNHIDYPNFNA